MAETHPLLELQRLDSEADALRARRDALPERALLGERGAEISSLESQRGEANEREVALGRDEHRVETQVTDARAKAQEIEATLYSGKVKVVNELKALQAELRSFQQRQREHEEAELALMEQQEQLAAEIAVLEGRNAALTSEAGVLRATLDVAEAEIDAELTRLAAARAGVVTQLDPPALASYEKLRAMPRLKGRVVARIEGEMCNGCFGAVPIAFASRFSQESADTTTECPRCGRLILH
jgi:predicted  nucleic acid-binding Zn-ribbon protein